MKKVPISCRRSLVLTGLLGCLLPMSFAQEAPPTVRLVVPSRRAAAIFWRARSARTWRRRRSRRT